MIFFGTAQGKRSVPGSKGLSYSNTYDAKQHDPKRNRDLID